MTLASLIFRGSSPVPLVSWSVIGFVAGIGLFVYGFRLLQRRRLILDTPFSKIRSASLGLVEISGLAVGPYTVAAPITDRSCYYYRTLVWEWKQHGKNKQWVKVASECMHVPFFVDDNTGLLLIDPRAADLDLHRDFEQEFCDSFFTTKDPAPDNIHSFLARHGVMTTNKIKVEEFCIKPKNALFILGTVAENYDLEVRPVPVPDSDAMTGPTAFNLAGHFVSLQAGLSTDELPTQPLFWETAVTTRTQMVPLSSGLAAATAVGMTQQQRIAAALSKAGISSPAAWKAAGLPAAGVQVVTDPSIAQLAPNGGASAVDQDSGLSASGFDPHPPVVLKKGEGNKTFLISWRSQREVVRTLGLKSILMIWGGPILAILSLYLFLSTENLFLSDADTPAISRPHHPSKLQP
ncbi:MAG: hypothetical protein ACRD3B_19730 [Candidatus Sulfotelmatobacter sp.]